MQEHRKCLTGLVKDVDEDDMLVYLYGCAKQGQWLKWDSAMQVDTSWKKLLYVWTPELLSFHINAIHDQLQTPMNLRLRGKTNLGSCQLCHHSNCTLFHILNGCNFSLQSGRYNWRHDQTLKAIASGVMLFIDEANQRKHGMPDNTNYIASHSALQMVQPTGTQPCLFQRRSEQTSYKRPTTGKS